MPAGDFNGDGLADFLIGSPGANAAGRSSAGVVYLFFGSNSSLITTDMSTYVTGATGVRFLGAAAMESLGLGVSGVGDVNGDGIDDIAFGAGTLVYNNRGLSGAIYILHGTKTAFTADVDFLQFKPSAKGFVIYGDSYDVRLCIASPAGDVDGDGVNDILVGGNGPNSRAHIVYGQKQVRTVNVDTATDDVMTFVYSNARLGNSLAGGKDLNGDNIPDILLGASEATVTPEAGGSAVNKAGVVFMLPGPFKLPNPTTSPSAPPTLAPTLPPSLKPSLRPSANPSFSPSASPGVSPTAPPSLNPTATPSANPSTMPTVVPSNVPTIDPTMLPTQMPTLAPSVIPTHVPTNAPSNLPTAKPTVPALKDFELVVDVEQVRCDFIRVCCFHSFL